VNVDERFGSEGRETDKTDRRSNRPVTIKCEENECRPVLLQPWDQPPPNIGIKRFSFTHRVSRIGVNHRKHRILVLGQPQICLDNLNRRRCIARRMFGRCSPVFFGHASDLHISRSAFTVLQFLVVATTESFFSMALLESLVLP
jgi:hypothetical protein